MPELLAATATRARADQAYADGIELRRIVDEYGIENVQLVLAALASRDKPRPIGPIRIPRLRDGSSSMEQHLDGIIREKARLHDLESGLEAALASKMDEWRKRQLAEIVRLAQAGQTAQQIAEAIGISDATVERRVGELKDIAVKEAEKKFGIRILDSSSLCGLFEGANSQTRSE